MLKLAFVPVMQGAVCTKSYNHMHAYEPIIQNKTMHMNIAILTKQEIRALRIQLIVLFLSNNRCIQVSNTEY